MGYQESTSPSTMSGGERDSRVRSMNEGRNGGVNFTAQSFNSSNIENGANESPEQETEEQQRKRRGRKGHSKSRRGCFNCKRARIKCKENRPSCDYCEHRGLKCEYPEIQISQHTQVGPLVRKAVTEEFQAVPAPLQAQGPVFTMQDFKLFNHFIQTAYPHQPIGNDSVWTHEIPSLASDYDFLLHSMLALSASDLASQQPLSPDLPHLALTYRCKAITSLNAAISKPLSSYEECNAMLATCYSLLFQSVLMPDGLIEYMTFIRGVMVVAIHMGKGSIKFLFHSMWNQVELMDDDLRKAPLIDPQLATGACRSLEAIVGFVVNPREIEYYGHLLTAARALFTSSRDAYISLTKVYGLFCYSMSHAEFSLFINPSNEAGKLLMSHFCALQLIMTPIAAKENKTRNREGDGTTVSWLGHIHERIKEGMEKYYEWPRWVEKELNAGRLKARENIEGCYFKADSHTYGTKIFTFRTSGRLGPPVQPAGILCKAIVHDILRTLVKDESNPVHDLAQVSRFNLGKS